jgi:nucleotide-binding universal stress UspA family protein
LEHRRTELSVLSGRATLARAGQKFKAKISTAVVEGSAKQVIMEKAVEMGMDLIAMGARGTKGIKPFFGGVLQGPWQSNLLSLSLS